MNIKNHVFWGLRSTQRKIAENEKKMHFASFVRLEPYPNGPRKHEKIKKKLP
jgi:hypothetical protein